MKRKPWFAASPFFVVAALLVLLLGCTVTYTITSHNNYSAVAKQAYDQGSLDTLYSIVNKIDSSSSFVLPPLFSNKLYVCTNYRPS